MVNSQKTMPAKGAVSKTTTTFSTPSTSAPTIKYNQMYITRVDSLGPYITIEGLLNSDALEIVQQRIENMLPYSKAINPSWPVNRQQEFLLPDVWCIYKEAEADRCKYSRARIINVIPATATPQTLIKAEIDITDYDKKTIVNGYDLLFPQQPDKLKYLPTLCSQYIVLGISEDWSEDQLKEVSRMIQYRTVNFFIVKEFMDYKFIRMKWKDFNFDEYIILHKNMGAPIEDRIVFSNFEKILKEYESKQQRVDENHFQQASSAYNVNNDKRNNNNTYIETVVSNDNNTYINDHFNKRINYKTPPLATLDGVNAPGVYLSKDHVRPILITRKNPLSSHQIIRTSTQHQANQMPKLKIELENAMMFKINGQQPVLPRLEYSLIPNAGTLKSIIPGSSTIINQNGMYNSVSYYHALGYSSKPEYLPQYDIKYGAACGHGSSLSAASYNGDIPSNQVILDKQVGSNYQSTLNAYAQYQKPYIPPYQTYHKKVISAAAKMENLTSRSTKTFKSNTLTVGQIYEVSVSFVEDGPFLFSIQDVSTQESLTDMMNRLEKVSLQKLAGKPTLGMACIARYSEDGQLYRALITSVQSVCCKVAYIDYGNAEIVNYNDLYEIPDEFLIHKAFAMRFTLSGHKDLEPIDESLKKAFKDLVLYKNCKLKVMPLEGPPLIQYCKLYLKQENNVLNILKQIQMKRLVYPKADALLNNDIVEIRYIDSPRHFYVQKAENIPEFEQLMDDIYLYYNKNQTVPNNLVLGAPCIVKYENEWYRAEVMRNNECSIMVRHVDFGYEQVVTRNLLSTIAEKHLKLPRQAIQCCLKGFENKEMNTDSASTQFEMLAEETNRKRRSFTVRVFRLQPDDVYLVNLCTKDINVMKKLYKLSMPFEQYLHFEKADFNMSPRKQKSINDDKENAHKTPSITSSSEVAPSVKLCSTNQNHDNPIPKYNSQMQSQSTITSLTRDANESTKALKPINLSAESLNNSSNFNATNVTSIGCDDQSSRGSVSTDYSNSRSSSNDLRQQNKQNNCSKNNNRREINHSNYNTNSSNSDAIVGENRTNVKSNSYNSSSHSQHQGEIPPRYTHYKNMQQQRMSRPRNAPQGFSQKHDSSNEKYYKSVNKPGASSTMPISNVPLQKKQQKHSLTPHSALSKNPNAVTSFTQSKVKKTSELYMPLNETFPTEPIKTPYTCDVMVSWWVSPSQFYTQLKSRSKKFEHFMQNIQRFYADKPSQQLQLKVGSIVMARHREDNIIYRACILGCNQMLRKYKVLFVDVGNQYTVTSEDIWQVEQRFFNFPVNAFQCSLKGIISNFDHLYIIDCMHKYLPPNARITCTYMDTASNNLDLYYVNIKVNGKPLRELLIKDFLITYISEDLRLDLLAGQQVRAKIFAIKDMLNFKIELRCYCNDIKFIPLLCSYDDVRFVKSNQDLAEQFKSFYKDKTCILNIKDVNNNQVLYVRPLMPLMKDDVDSLICTPPVVFETFEVRIVYVASPYRLYGQMLSTESKMNELLNDMYNYYETEGKGFRLKSFDSGQICAAKGSDGNWYRARIIATQSLNNTKYVNVYYPDYGNTESVVKENLKYLEEKFYKNINAYGLEINLPIKPLSHDNCQQQTHQEQTDVQNKKYSDITAYTAASSTANDNELDIKVINYLSEITLDKGVLVKALEMRHNHLIADLLTPQSQSIVNMLKNENLIVERDLDYMRQILDEEKPNTLEYIEMVDLTLEDDGGGEMEANKKHEIKSTSIHTEEEDSDVKVEAQEETCKSNDKMTISAKEIKKQDESPTLVPLAANGSSIEVASENVVKEDELNTSNGLEKMESGILAHCDTPAQFFIHPMDKMKDLKVLQDNLQIVASQLPPLRRIINGAYCISMYSVDKQWYRAQILDAELMVLQYIDFGNTDCVTDAGDLKEMLIYPNLKPLCIPCGLPIRPNGTADWVDAANAIFNDSYNKVLKFKFILDRRETDKKNFIDLYIDGVNITKHLIKEGYAQQLQLADNGETCYISHVNAINDFYIQYEKNSKALELMELYFADYMKLQPLKEFVPHKIVAARFREDQMWYRAELLKETEDGYEVLFIDYGNTSISAECREISDKNIALLLPLSQKCSLELPDYCLSWSEPAEKKFHEIAATGETIFSVELREPANDHAIVHLLIDGHNIIDDLEILCERRHVDDRSENNFNNPFLPSRNSRDDNSAIVSDVETSNDIFPRTKCLKGRPISENKVSDDHRIVQKCIITHAISPSNFYVQLQEQSKVLNYVNKYLRDREFVAELKVLTNIMPDTLCVVYSKQDECYYRGRTINTISYNGKYEVFLLDYGNTIFTSDIREMPDTISKAQELAIHCKLGAIPLRVTEKELAETFTSLMDIHFGDIYDMEIISQKYDKMGSNLFTVNLQVNCTDLAEELLEALTSPEKLVLKYYDLGKIHDALIIHINSVESFFVQLIKDKMSIQKISERLENAEHDLTRLNDLEVGKICIAQFPDDGAYYRAEIVCVLDDRKCEVHFIDFGNNSITDQLRQVPEDLLSVERFSKHCSLDSTCPINEQFNEQFISFHNSHISETFQLEFLNRSTSLHRVRAYYRGKNIIKEIQNLLNVKKEE